MDYQQGAACTDGNELVAELEESQGVLHGLAAAPGEPLEYQLTIGTKTLVLSNYVGTGVRVRFLDEISCGHCGSRTRKSYGRGYCYACFKTLARCDLCMVDPSRCHFAAGTCREPQWAQGFCTQNHTVYLANSSGVKVGITRAGREFGRWTDQGAVQALRLIHAETRPMAGQLEAQLAQFVSDRTRWRDLVTQRSAAVALVEIASDLRNKIRLPPQAYWVEPFVEQHFSYPILRHAPDVRLKLDANCPIEGVLLGIKGQFLLFPQGVFNVSEHANQHIALEFFPASVDDVPHNDQLELF